MNESTLHFDQLSPEAQARILSNNEAMAELERQVEEHVARQPERERVDEELRKYLDIDVDPPLTFEAYQAGAKKTAIYNRDARVLYPALGLPGEVGEVLEKATNLLMMAVHSGKLANQVKKIIRDDDCECDTPRKHDIGKEIGGVLWYCAAVASDLGLDLGAIAQENLDILASRQKRGTIKGDGDNR